MKILHSIQTAADTSDSEALDIQLLGVPADWVDLQPTATRFPRSFSNESNQIWSKMFSCKEHADSIRAFPTVALQWKAAFKLFMKICDEKGVAPFSSIRNRVDNSSLIDFLKTSRIRLVTFFNDHRVFEVLRIIRGTQSRVYEVGYSKFGVKVVAQVKSPFRNLPDLEKYLYAMEFKKEPNQSYKRIITPNCIIHVDAKFVNRVKVMYTIQGNQSLFLGTKYKLPTKKQVQSFADTIIFLPVIRSHRIRALGTHTLF